MEWGFFRLVQKSTNQYSSNIISLINAIPKNGKALDKAFLKHRGKQTQPIGESNRSIDKQVTIEPETIEPTGSVSIETTPKEITKSFFNLSEEEIIESLNIPTERRDTILREIRNFRNYWTEKNSTGTKERWQMEKTFEVKRRLQTWFDRAGNNFTPNQKPR